MKTTKRGVPLTRCSETLTEAQFFSWIRSQARRISTRWKPRSDLIKENRRPYTGSSKRTKWEYQCKECNEWFVFTKIEVDHIMPCGKLTCFEDIGPYYERLLCEKDGFQCLCKLCHRRKTNKN